MMVILGIDPGLNATGYGVIEATGQLRMIAAGAIRPPARQPLAQRVLAIYDALDEVVQSTHPAIAVLESLFTHHTYLTTAALMAHARSLAFLVSAQHHLTVVEYLPTRIKKAVTGYGAASKDQVARAVKVWLQVDTSAWPADTTDALALAIAHAHIGKTDATLGMLVGSRHRQMRISSRGLRPQANLRSEVSRLASSGTGRRSSVTKIVPACGPRWSARQPISVSRCPARTT